MFQLEFNWRYWFSLDLSHHCSGVQLRTVRLTRLYSVIYYELVLQTNTLQTMLRPSSMGEKVRPDILPLTHHPMRPDLRQAEAECKFTAFTNGKKKSNMLTE